MRELIKKRIDEHSEMISKLYDVCNDDIKIAAQLMIDCILDGGKIMFAGNGGSCCDGLHATAELTNRFMKNRSPLPAISLNCDIATISAVSNDFSYEEIFIKQIQAIGSSKDLFFAITTSGNSRNILEAAPVCDIKGIRTIILTGENGGKFLRNKVDHVIAVPENITARIQEAHILILHILCEIIEETIFGGK